MDIKILEIGLQVQCDFRCSYCISEKADNWTNLTSLNTDKLIEFIGAYFDSSVLIALTGGEPLLWGGLQKLVETYPNNLFMISSNIKHIIKHDWLINPTDELRDRLCFRIGWHPNVRTDDFLEKINIIKNAGYHYVVNYMVENEDLNHNEKIQFLKDNNIVYEVSAEENGILGSRKDGVTSTQYYMRNFVDNKYFMRINSNANVYPCYTGNPIGNVDNLELSDKMNDKYCPDCTGLKGYTKILSQWDKFDFSSITPQRDRFNNDKEYQVSTELVDYVDIIDDVDSLTKFKSYRVKF